MILFSGNWVRFCFVFGFFLFVYASVWSPPIFELFNKTCISILLEVCRIEGPGKIESIYKCYGCVNKSNNNNKIIYLYFFLPKKRRRFLICILKFLLCTFHARFTPNFMIYLFNQIVRSDHWVSLYQDFVK